MSVVVGVGVDVLVNELKWKFGSGMGKPPSRWSSAPLSYVG